MARKRTALAIGRGRLYFDRFVPGTRVGEGELYFGNTPDLTVSRSITTTDEWESYGNERHQVEGEIIEQSHEAKFSTDHMSAENLGLWYGSAPQPHFVPKLVAVREAKQVTRGRYYQLGTTPAAPFGVRAVSAVRVFRGSVNITSGFDANFELDGPSGRLYVKPNAPDIIDRELLTFEFDHQSSGGQQVVTGKTELLGALRFESTNPIGPKFNFLFPCVALTSSAAFDLKSEAWMKLSFNVDARKLTPSTEYVYVESTGDFGNLTPEEVAIINQGIRPNQFLPLEDKLYTLINITMPSRGYPL